MTLDQNDIYDIAKAVVKVTEEKDMMKSEEKKNLFPLASLHKGDSFSIAGREWIVLAQDIELAHMTFVITKECLEEKIIFDINTNNWTWSSLRTKVNNIIQKEMVSQFNKNIIKTCPIDLTPLDGSHCYGNRPEKVGLLTFNDYVTFRKYIPRIDKQWVLATPYTSIDENFICCVSSLGTIVKDVVCADHNIRPVCMLSNKGVLVEKVSD